MSKDSVFSIKTILSHSWECVRTKFIEVIGLTVWFAVVIGVVIASITLVFGGIGLLAANAVIMAVISFFGMFLAAIAYIIVCFGFIKNFLNLCRGEKIDLFAFVRVKSRTMFSFILAAVLCSTTVVIGSLLVVPGLILLYLFMYVPFLIIDRDMGPIEAIKESVKMAGGKRRSEIFIGLYVSLVIIAFVTALSFFTLTVVAMPMAYFVWVYPYMVLTGDLEKVKKCLLKSDDDTIAAATPMCKDEA